MKNIKVGNYEKYSILESDNEDRSEIGGTTKKCFIRLDSSLLKGYLKAALKEGANYVTYIDDFIKENCDNTSKDIPIKYVSVLIKESRMNVEENALKEVLGSRLTNLMGFPTVYNDMTTINGDYYTVSIDFLKEGQEVEILENQTKIDDFSTFEQWENLLDIDFNEIIEENNPHKDKIIDKLKRDFVKQYILKSLIFDDMDFYPRNVAYIKEKMPDNTFDYKLAPLLDYELIFAFRKNNLMDLACKESVEYFLKHYPEEINMFVKTIEKNLYKDGNIQSDKLYRVIKQATDDEYYQDFFKNKIIKNIDRFINEYYKQINTKEINELV